MTIELGNGVQVSGAAAPWVALLSVLLLSAAGAVARIVAGRIGRRSTRPQGERLGALERRVETERTRRLQVENVLMDLGVPLPWWPPDGLAGRPPRHPSRPAEAEPSRGPDDEDQADDEADDENQPMTEARRIPVPPLPPAATEAAARHRRPAGV